MRLYLKRLREAKDLTQKEIAKDLGISQNYYSNIENGIRLKCLDIKTLIKLSNILDVNLNELIYEEAQLEREGA